MRRYSVALCSSLSSGFVEGVQHVLGAPVAPLRARRCGSEREFIIAGWTSFPIRSVRNLRHLFRFHRRRQENVFYRANFATNCRCFWLFWGRTHARVDDKSAYFKARVIYRSFAPLCRKCLPSSNVSLTYVRPVKNTTLWGTIWFNYNDSIKAREFRCRRCQLPLPQNVYKRRLECGKQFQSPSLYWGGSSGGLDQSIWVGHSPWLMGTKPGRWQQRWQHWTCIGTGCRTGKSAWGGQGLKLIDFLLGWPACTHTEAYVHTETVSPAGGKLEGSR